MIITTISAISNEIKEIDRGGGTQGKRKGNKDEVSFSNIVNYLKNSYINENPKISEGNVDVSGPSLDEETHKSNVECSDLTALGNAMNLFLNSTSIGTVYEEGKGALVEPIEQEDFILHSHLEGKKYEINEILMKLKETQVNSDVKDLLSQFSTADEADTFSTFIKEYILHNNVDSEKPILKESLEEKWITDKVLSSSEDPISLEYGLNKDILVNNQQSSSEEEAVLFGEKELNNNPKKDLNTSKDNAEENFSQEDVAFLKSLLEDKGISKGNYPVITTRAPIESNHTFTKEISLVNSKTLKEDLIKVINYAWKGNIQEIKVKINPEELGSMIVRLSLEENSIKAKVKVSSEETYKLLINNLGDLKNTLKSGEIKIQEVEVSLFKEDSFFYSEDNRNNSYGEKDRNNNQHYPSVMESISNKDKEGVNHSEILLEGSINSLV